jgi:hypothetical protein
VKGLAVQNNHPLVFRVKIRLLRCHYKTLAVRRPEVCDGRHSSLVRNWTAALMDLDDGVKWNEGRMQLSPV